MTNPILHTTLKLEKYSTPFVKGENIDPIYLVDAWQYIIIAIQRRSLRLC